MKKLIASCLLIIQSALLYGQSATFTSSADTNRILIGEQIVVKLKANLPQGAQFTWPVYADTVKGLELVEQGKLDTTTSGENLELTQKLTITSFDSGYVAFPPMELLLSGKRLSAPAIAIEVGMPQLQPEQDIYDIKEPLEAPFDWLPILLWILGAVLIVIGIIVFIQWLKNRQKQEKLTPEQKLTPYEFAMWQLQEIEKEQLWQAGKVKEYYSRITDVVRLYMERQMRINAMESTADEVIQKMNGLGLPEDLNRRSAELFRLSAMVKYAKKQPGREEHEAAMHTVKAFLEYTRPAEANKETKKEQPEVK